MSIILLVCGMDRAWRARLALCLRASEGPRTARTSAPKCPRKTYVDNVTRHVISTIQRFGLELELCSALGILCCFTVAGLDHGVVAVIRAILAPRDISRIKADVSAAVLRVKSSVAF